MIMKNMTKINRISLAILVAIGMQYFIVGAFTFNTIDFSSFSLLNWILEIIYLTFTISLALRTDI
jgi:membrane protein insertase Oxa1/YidC/SpoIIIJ